MTIPRCSEPNCIAPAASIATRLHPLRRRLVCAAHSWEVAADESVVSMEAEPTLAKQIEHLKRLLGPKKEER